MTPVKKTAISIGKTAAAIAFWIAVWFALALAVNEKLIVPTPLAVLHSLWEIIITSEFWIPAVLSLIRVILGVAISIVIGCISAYLISKSKLLRTLVSPLLSIIKATPVASFIVIAWVWIDTDYLPIFIASLIVIPIITSNVLQGISAIDKELLEVARIYRFSPLKRLYRLYIPTIAPYFLAACRSSLGMAWKASVAAEMIVLTRNSIGREIYYAKNNFETAPVFAWTIIVIVLSVIIERAIVLSLNKLGRSMRLMPKGEGYAEN